jgi:hypothetical protein
MDDWHVIVTRRSPGARPRIVVRSAAMNFDDLLDVYRAWLLIFGEDTAIMHAGAEVELG